MIGQIIGNTYRIEAKVGEGGMGAVYRGRDLMLERDVAVKVLRPELARQPELAQRFRTEAMTLAKLSHPNIAKLHSFLKEGDESFMVMEFVHGTPLDGWIERHGAMPLVEATHVFCQALEALGYAHRLGIVHRDIKPANLMLTTQGDAVVMDFGIVRVLGTAGQTRTGQIFGTLAYMSPEQLQGKEIDTRADLYSLGILYYELLTGRAPFEATSDYGLIRAQVEDAPTPPRELTGDAVPVAVELALLRALAKDPDARFQTAEELRAALLAAVPEAAQKPASLAASALKATRVAAAAQGPLPETRLPDPPAPSAAPRGLRAWSWKPYAGAAAVLTAIIAPWAVWHDRTPASTPMPAPSPIVSELFVRPTPPPNEIAPLPPSEPSPLPAPRPAARRTVPQPNIARFDPKPTPPVVTATPPPERRQQDPAQPKRDVQIRVQIPKTGMGVDLKLPFGRKKN